MTNKSIDYSFGEIKTVPISEYGIPVEGSGLEDITGKLIYRLDLDEDGKVKKIVEVDDD